MISTVGWQRSWHGDEQLADFGPRPGSYPPRFTVPGDTQSATTPTTELIWDWFGHPPGKMRTAEAS